MDKITKIAGYWNLEFGDGAEGGQSGGVPGGMGSLNLGKWGQALYVVATVADIVLTVVTLGGSLALKGALKGLSLGLKRAFTSLAKLFTRQGLKKLGTKIATFFGRRFSSLSRTGLQQIFRKGVKKIAEDAPISLRRLKMLLGRAKMGTNKYKIVQASAEDAARLGDDVFGWVSRTGSGQIARAADGRPIINLTERALSSVKEAVTTVGHEIKHILDPHATEALAEAFGERFYDKFLKNIKRFL
jgi:hypothetical protein